MLFRGGAALIVLVVLALAGCGTSAEIDPLPTQTFQQQPPSLISAASIDGCGVVAYPATGARGTVVVTSGATTCGEAMRIVDRYLHDRSLVHTGNTWAADFEGWSCVTPTSAAGEEYGYLSACRDLSGSEIRVTKEQPPGAAPLGAECSAPVVAADMGQPLHIERCYGDWAYVSAGESGTA